MVSLTQFVADAVHLVLQPLTLGGLALVLCISRELFGPERRPLRYIVSFLIVVVVAVLGLLVAIQLAGVKPQG